MLKVALEVCFSFTSANERVITWISVPAAVPNKRYNESDNKQRPNCSKYRGNNGCGAFGRHNAAKLLAGEYQQHRGALKSHVTNAWLPVP